MLKKLVFVGIFWSGLSINAWAEMLIKQDLSVSIEVEAAKYISFINIRESESLRKLKSLSMEDKNIIIKTYNTLNTFLGENSICKGGSFNIEPIYAYKNGTRMQNGFETHYSLNCEFTKEQKKSYDQIIQKIEEEARKNPYLLFALPSIEKVVDEKKLAEIDEQLNMELLELAMQKAKEYSKFSKQKCSVKEINLSPIVQERAMPTTLKASLNAARDEAKSLESVNLPTAKPTQKMARGNVVFSCR